MAQSEHIRLAGKHQQSRHQKQDIAQQHHPAQTADGEVLPLIALLHLHRGKGDGSHSEDVWRTLPLQDTGTRANDHQHGTNQENDILQATQLSHSSQSV